MTKLSVFIAVAVLSVAPTLEFLSWRKALKAGQVPSVDAKKLRFIKTIIHGELAAIVIIVLCAAIMARGGWVWGSASVPASTQIPVATCSCNLLKIS